MWPVLLWDMKGETAFWSRYFPYMGSLKDDSNIQYYDRDWRKEGPELVIDRLADFTDDDASSISNSI